MYRLLIPLIYFLLSNALLVFISKKTFGKCIPLTFMITSFIYFFTQAIFHTFKVGLFINLLLPLIIIGIIIYKLIKKEDLNEFKNNYFSNGFYIFLIIYLFILVFNYNRSFSNWDEFSHWGVMIKEMLRLDRFYSVPESTLLVHKDYPPIMQMYELFFIHLAGSYQERFLVSSVNLFSLSLFIPAIVEDKNKKLINIFIKSILMILIVLLLLLSFDQHMIINCIYIDYFMAILIAYLLFNILNEKDLFNIFNIVKFSLGLSFLLLLKQIGLPLYLMILFMFIVCAYLRNKKDLKVKNNIIKLLILLIIPLSLWKGWNMYVSTLDVKAQFNLSDIKPLELVGVIRNKTGETWQKEASNNYIEAIQTENISNTKFNFSYIQCILLVYIILFALYLLFKKELNKKEIILLGITLGIGFIGYTLVMLLLYVSSFGPIEGPMLSSYDRYMTTYVLICLITFLMLYLNIDSNKKKENYLYLFLLFATLFLIQKPERIGDVLPKLNKSYNPYQELGEYLSTKVEENSKVFVITQNLYGDAQFAIKYYAGPIITNPDIYKFDTKDIDNYEKYYKDHYEKIIEQYDYLYLVKIDDDFKNNYGFIFNEEIKEKDIYKIIKEENNIKFEKLS